MIYVDVPKDIREYKSKGWLGLTWQSIRYIGVAVGISIILSFLLFKYIGTQGVSIIITFAIVPAAAIGLVEKEGMPLKVYLKLLVTFYVNKQKLSYENSIIKKEGSEVNEESFIQNFKKKRESRRKRKESEQMLEDGTKKTRTFKKKFGKGHSI